MNNEIDISRNVMRGFGLRHDIESISEDNDSAVLMTAMNETVATLALVPQNIYVSTEKIAEMVGTMKIVEDYMATDNGGKITEAIKTHIDNLWKWLVEIWKKMTTSTKALWNKYTGKDADAIRRRIAVVKSDLKKMSTIKDINKDKSINVLDLKYTDISKLIVESMTCANYTNFDFKNRTIGGEYSIVKIVDYIKSSNDVEVLVKDPSKANENMKSTMMKIITFSNSFKDVIGGESKMGNIRIYKAMMDKKFSSSSLKIDTEKLKKISDIGTQVMEHKTKTLKGNQILAVRSDYENAINLLERIFDNMNNNTKEIESLSDKVTSIAKKFEGATSSPNKEEGKDGNTNKNTNTSSTDGSEDKQMDTQLVGNFTTSLNDVLTANRDIASTIFDATTMASNMLDKLLTNIEYYAKNGAR